MQFVPLWTSISRSRKVARLDGDLFKLWVMCLVMAQENDHRRGTLPSQDDLSYVLHMEPPALAAGLRRLVEMEFIDDADGIYTIHDWQDWKYQRDPTAAARKRLERDRKQHKPGPRGVVGVPADVTHVTEVTIPAVTGECHAPITVSQIKLPQHTPPTPGDGGKKECVSEDTEPFDPGPPGSGAEPPAPTAEERRVIDGATRRWGASCGDSVVGDLLRDYGPAIVSAACDVHWDQVERGLSPRRLRGICRSMFTGNWKLPGNAARASPTPAPVRETVPMPSPEGLARMVEVNRQYEEYQRRMGARHG